MDQLGEPGIAGGNAPSWGGKKKNSGGETGPGTTAKSLLVKILGGKGKAPKKAKKIKIRGVHQDGKT